DALLWLPGVFVEQGWASFRLPVAAGEWWIYPLFLLPVGVLAYLAMVWDPFALRRLSNVKAAVWVAVPAAFIAAITIAMLNSSPAMPAGNGKLTVHFLDVGQGDSAFIVFPNGETMLIDGGGLVDFRKRRDDEDQEPFEPDVARIGEMVVSETLWEMGYSRIDHVVASHADADHIQGLVDAAKNFEIGRAYFAGVQGESEDSAELLAVLAKKGVPVAWLERGNRLEIGGAVVDVLHPSAGDADLTENDRSLVFTLTFGERRFLFTGDIEAEAERRVVANGGLIMSDVVKVPHHGSRTSSSNAFAEAVRPELAVIPVGNRSRFGHPHYQTVEMWKTFGAELKTTGEKGMLSVVTDGKSLDINTFLK
ncbi:MAG: ComEC/Rec2 family competence protein, partial [Pyrinomonadaceae bacterium]|nr:ComEC/Rec2 family competence protein [Pyrinomonadaceae bacterium]